MTAARGTGASSLLADAREGLDRVVPVTNTRTYASLIRNARYELLEGTGHIGVLTKPERFATLISDFAHAHTH